MRAVSVRAQSILLVEDDPALALGLVDTLEFEGFEVHHAQSGEDAVRLLGEHRLDCIILDLMLPGMNGYQVCERVRARNERVPILMLTARSQESDKIRGLDAGADDYVTKPFSVGELVARVRALLRRARRTSTSDSEVFEVAGRLVDPVKQIMLIHGEEQQLSYHEVELLKLLVAREGQPVSRDEIMERVWGQEAHPSSRTVDNVIVKLRKRIESAPDKPEHILTVYGVGYKLVR